MHDVDLNSPLYLKDSGYDTYGSSQSENSSIQNREEDSLSWYDTGKWVEAAVHPYPISTHKKSNTLLFRKQNMRTKS